VLHAGDIGRSDARVRRIDVIGAPLQTEAMARYSLTLALTLASAVAAACAQ
jgi:hypothetical protein